MNLLFAKGLQDRSGSTYYIICGNKSAIQMFKNPIHHEKTKHIDIDCYFDRHHVSIGFVKPRNMESSKQILTFLPRLLDQLCSNNYCLNSTWDAPMSSLKET